LKEVGEAPEKISVQFCGYHKALVLKEHETVIAEPAASDTSEYPSDFSLQSESSIIENISQDIMSERQKNEAKREEKLKS
jgi:hypothetical protein